MNRRWENTVVDGGIPRIFVGVHGSIGSLHALRRAVAEARERRGVVYSVIAWRPPGGDLLDRRVPAPDLRRYWTTTVLMSLRAAWQDAFGGAPDDVPVHLLAERGRPGWVLTGLADSEDDLIVVGAGRPGPMRRLRPSVARYCVAKASCPVLVVPPSPLDRQLGHRHRWEIGDLLDNFS